MKKLFLFGAIVFSVIAKSQAIYNYNLLPDSLKKDAQYVIWEDLVEFEVFDEGKAKESGRLAVCILNQNARSYNSFYIPYRKGESVNRFDATIYDANGKMVKKLKNTDIKDMSSVSDFSLFEDDRIKLAEFTHNEYPYTLVFEYEKNVNGLFNYPTKIFQRHEKSTVIKSTIQMIIPGDYKLRYREFNLKNKVSINREKWRQIFRWEETHIMPEQDHDLMPHPKYYERMLKLAPLDFSEGGYKGNLDSWKNYGFWVKSLNDGRDQLSDLTKQNILNLVKDAKNDKEKVKILYNYMQNKTRYVSVQKGIGGYQPFTADYVDSKGYGDCKALSNYMYSLLKAVGIKSYYTDVQAGTAADEIFNDFPSNQFNHDILCVPMQNDTIWLECTSQKQPFNFLGSFTDDRHVLLVTDDGGKLVKTPRYPKEINTQFRKAMVDIDAEGNAKAVINTVFSGLQYENRPGLSDMSVKDRNEALNKIYPVSGMIINSCQYTENKDEIPSVTEKLDISFPKYASISSKRMFIKLNQLNTDINVPKNEERKIPFQLRSEFIDIDTVQFTIPSTYSIESMPKEVALNTKFGSYSFSVLQKDNVFTCIRKYSSEKGTFDASDYKAYYEYKKQISLANKAKLVFIRKD